MKKITSLTILLLLMFLSSYGQEKTIEKSYQEYFNIPREALFIHTNKTTYLTGENIWLKTYAFDRKNTLPSRKTTNIYIGIYDSTGNQIDKKLFLAKDGSGAGSIKLDSTLQSGTYYLKALTNWMKNYKEDDSYVQKIEIINSKKLNKKTVNKVKFDLQFLPEGGHFIANVKNTIGFKFLNDNGKGDYITGNIYDQEDNIISTFKSNILGMGKFSLTPLPNKTYYAKFDLGGGSFETVNLPTAESKGVAISVNNLRKDKLLVSLHTNKTTLPDLSSNQFKLLIHRDGLIKTIGFTMNQLTQIIPIPKEELLSGINIITLVDHENSPVLERLIFNNDSFTKMPLTISQKSVDFDSIHYSLRSIRALKNNEIANLSISVLPTQTKSYDSNNNVISSFLIKPYVKGNIEKPYFYFKDFGLKAKYDLDILLLTQGWSKYSWKDVLKGQQTPLYDFENGISFNGRISSNLKNVKSFVVYPTKYNGTKFIDVDENGKFNINNYFIEKGETISFSAMMKNNKMRRPIVGLSPIIKLGKDKLKFNQLSKSFASYYSNKNNIPQNFITKGFEELDEVTITIKKKERLTDPQFPNAKITQVTENIARSYPFILDYIANNGFDVFDGSVATGNSRLGSVTITSRGRGSATPPVLFIDDILMQNFDILQTLTMDKVERVLIDRSGIGLGLSGGNAFGGVIKITTRNTSLLSPNLSTPDIFKTKATYGFEPVKEFYAPKYPSYRIQSFRDYGIIHWEPNATVSNLSEYKFKIINTELEEISFFIEGVSSEGKLFSLVIRMNNKVSK